MFICRTIKELHGVLKENCYHKSISSKIGFVPTMGALHQGHVSLAKKSSDRGNFTVVSIFVNPTQFNNPDDFRKYPITIEQDIAFLQSSKYCHVLFIPTSDEIYPPHDDHFFLEHYELGSLENILEGLYRPNHFQGVCKVLHKLFVLVAPNEVFMGQKDYQQCLVVGQLLKLVFALKNIQMIVCDTFREDSGLAMSSRNQRLNNEEKEKATVFYKAAQYAQQHINKHNFKELQTNIVQMIINSGFEKIDYVEFCDITSLEILNNSGSRVNVVLVIAGFLNSVRLIDNFMIAVKP
ncbi:MAG: pantoate--beta-alanine ligase [Phycisphaerales bacterium]|nr:pantoate--beta-alanine ligase [Phycisphaerales bacterium]